MDECLLLTHSHEALIHCLFCVVSGAVTEQTQEQAVDMDRALLQHHTHVHDVHTHVHDVHTLLML